MDFAPDVQQDITEVLDGGFLTWRSISSSPEPLVVAFLPITQENQVTRVLLVGHRTSGSIPKALFNVYLAVAGLVGTTADRLASEAELRKHRQHLEELVGKRTAKLTKTNEQLQQEITHRQRAEDALQKAHDELELRVQERTAELEKAKEAITAERQRLYDILEAMPVMVCLLTPDYRVAFANRSIREKFGEDHGRRCFDYRFGLREPCGFLRIIQRLENRQTLSLGSYRSGWLYHRFLRLPLYRHRRLSSHPGDRNRYHRTQTCRGSITRGRCLQS